MINLKFKDEYGTIYPVQEVQDYFVIIGDTEYLSTSETSKIFEPFNGFPVIKSLSSQNNDYWLVEKDKINCSETPYEHFKRVYNKEERKLAHFYFHAAKRVKYIVTSKTYLVNENVLDEDEK